MQRLEHRACFGGWQDVYRHDSKVLGCEMTVGVYLPPQAEHGPCPVLYWLSGLTCTEQNFITKAGAQRYAAEHGIILSAVRAISGHSMGGHGALTIALKNPGRYRSVSAFSPIVAPSQVGWGQKAFAAYLGEDREVWRAYDATELVAHAQEKLPLLIDQGGADEFLQNQLRPELLQAVCEAAGHPLQLRMQPGYDHSYYFISSFIGDHIAHHAEAMR